MAIPFGEKVVVRHKIGPIKLIKDFLQRTGIAKIIDKVCPPDIRQLLPWGTVAEIMIINRLLAPKPLYKVEEWVKNEGVDLLYGICSDILNDDRLGRALEVFAENEATLKAEIALHLIKEFNISLKYVHWDLTKVKVEGEYEKQQDGSVQIVRARDRRGQPVEKSFNVGLSTADDSNSPVPVFYELFNGNINGHLASPENIKNLKSLVDSINSNTLVRINDAGACSAKVVWEIKQEGFDIISAIRMEKTMEEHIRHAIASGTEWKELSYISQNQEQKKSDEKDKYYAFEMDYTLKHKKHLIPVRLIVVLSDGKVKRDRKNRNKHINWIQQQLDKLKKAIGSNPSYYTKKRINKKINKIISQYPEGKFFNIKNEYDPKTQKHSFSYEINEEKLKHKEVMDGIYTLITTLPINQYDIDKVFTLYKRQCYAENANRIIKSKIKLKPIYLKNNKRIHGLLFVTWLALMTYMLMQREYRKNSPEPKQEREKVTTRIILEAFSGYTYYESCRKGTRVILCYNELTPAQKKIYKALKLSLPSKTKSIVHPKQISRLAVPAADTS